MCHIRPWNKMIYGNIIRGHQDIPIDFMNLCKTCSHLPVLFNLLQFSLLRRIEFIRNPRHTEVALLQIYNHVVLIINFIALFNLHNIYFKPIPIIDSYLHFHSKIPALIKYPFKDIAPLNFF